MRGSWSPTKPRLFRKIGSVETSDNTCWNSSKALQETKILRIFDI